VSLIAVFIPLLFMSGLVGRMFREFALTLTIAVVTSAIVSLTLTPMMCSRLLKHAGEELVVPGLATISRGIDRMVEFYHRTLLWVLERQRATMMVTFATIAATLILYVVAPKGFLPLQDTASITAVTEAGSLGSSGTELQAVFVNPATGIYAPGDQRWLPAISGTDEVAVHADYNGRGQLICCSATLEFWLVGHGLEPRPRPAHAGALGARLKQGLA